MEFINRYTFGFDEYREYVMGTEDGEPKDPKWAEKHTAVPAQAIERLTLKYATTKPAALLAGVGPGRTDSGAMIHLAAADPVEQGATPLKEHLPLFLFTPKFGILTTKRVQFGKMADAILKGKAGGYPADFKMLVVWMCNHLNAMPNINKTVRALRRIDFIVVNEQHMTPTAKFADILLPTCTYMERNDIVLGHQTPFYGCQNKVIEPPGDSKPPLDICMRWPRSWELLAITTRRKRNGRR